MRKNKDKKQRLILISDLWGIENSGWIDFYISILNQYFEVVYYDSCELGDIDTSDYTAENLHYQFLNGGISKAVENLLQIEKQPTIILGFSIGGFIAWKACLSFLSIQNLYAISSTRLRYENEKPIVNIELFYGENDPYKPSSDWFEHLDIKQQLYLNETHDFYKNKNVAEDICKLIIAQLI